MLVSILVVVVIVIAVGITIAWRSGTAKGPGAMAGQGQDALSSVGWGSPTPGLWCLVGGLAAAAGVAMIGQATYGWVSGFEVPGWLRIVTFWMFPGGVITAAILGTLSLKRNSGRILGITGLALAVLSAGTFFVMVASAAY